MTEAAEAREAGGGRDRWSGLTGGVILIAVGLGFLLAEMDVFDLRDFWRWGPLVIVALGAARVAGGRVWSEVKGGLQLLVVGGWLLATTQGFGDFDFRNSWPLLLIGFGAIAVAEAFVRQGSARARREVSHDR